MDIRDSHTHIVIVVVDSHVPDSSPDTALLYVRVACPVRVLGSLLVNEVPATRAPRRSPSFSLGPAQVLTRYGCDVVFHDGQGVRRDKLHPLGSHLLLPRCTAVFEPLARPS